MAINIGRHTIKKQAVLVHAVCVLIKYSNLEAKKVFNILLECKSYLLM